MFSAIIMMLIVILPVVWCGVVWHGAYFSKVTSVIQCNGNRREDFHFIDGKTPAFGPPHWVAGAIGNSTWTGVRMRDVLRAAGADAAPTSMLGPMCTIVLCHCVPRYLFL